jgi:acyl-CoA synthetase (AMP-forming)/AMP-acid ligase II
MNLLHHPRKAHPASRARRIPRAELILIRQHLRVPEASSLSTQLTRALRPACNGLQAPRADLGAEDAAMTNLAGIVWDALAGHANGAAVRQGDRVLSYAELARAAGQVASLLRGEGVRPGDRVAVMLPNVAAFPVLAYGTLAAGAVVVPMNPLLKGREVAHYLGDSGARLMFAAEPAAAEAAKGAAETGARVIPVTDADAAALRTEQPPTSWADADDDDDALIWSTRTAKTCRRARSARSPSAGTT